MTDEETKLSIYSEERKKSLKYFDAIKSVTFKENMSKKERSRWIKTNMRNLVDGDFLFIDADTIITNSLDEIDKFEFSIGAVLDSHCHSSLICDTVVFKDMYIDRLKSIFDVEYSGEDVFNSGVIFVKDDAKAHQFFETWHKNWKYSCSKGICLDQLSLLKTNIELNNKIYEMSGEYNCQIRFSVEYLTRAKILHTFATQRDSGLSVLLGPQIYDEIKRNHDITDKITEVLIRCKETFTSPSYLVGKEWQELWFMPVFGLVYSTYKSSSNLDRIAFKMINFLARVIAYSLRKMR